MAEHPQVGRLLVYRDKAGEWRWTAYASNGRALAVSSEGYVNHGDAYGAAESLFPGVGIEEPVADDAPD